MYINHFGLSTDPFPLTPKLFFVYQSRAYGETMAHLVYGIEQEEGIVLITGGIGTGKTLALQSLLSQLSGPIDPVLVNVTQMDWVELLRYILLEMGEKPAQGLGVADLVQQLKSVLEERRDRGRKVLLIVDEAQHLDVQALEGLRLLMNLSSPEKPSLQLILVGQQALEQTISRLELSQLNQRIRVRYRLQPLTRKELEQYIAHRTLVAGSEQPIFKAGAVDRIFELSGGIPRVVNILASRAMLAAYVEKSPKVDHRHVRVEDLPPLSDKPEAPPSETVAPAELMAPEEPAAKPEPKPAPVKREVAPPSPPPPPPPPALKPILPPEGVERSRPNRQFMMMTIPVLLLLVIAVIAWQLDLGSIRTRMTAPLPDVPATATLLPATPVVEGQVPDKAAVETDDVAEVPVQPEPEALINQPAVVVHVGSFRENARAETYLGMLRDSGAQVFSESVAADGETWVRVYLGPFVDTLEAGALIERLSADGLVAYNRTIIRES